MSEKRQYRSHIRKTSNIKQLNNSSKDISFLDSITTQYRQNNIKSPITDLTHSLKLRKFEQYFTYEKTKNELNKKQIVNIDKLSQMPYFISFDTNPLKKQDQVNTKIVKKDLKVRKTISKEGHTTQNDGGNSENNFIVEQVLQNNSVKVRYQSQEIRHSENSKYPPYYHHQPARLKFKLYKDLNFHTNKFQGSNSPVLFKKTIAKTHTLQNWISRLNPHNIMTNKFFLDFVLITHSMLFEEVNAPNYYNIYVEQGNNQQLVKRIVRKRSGWRVVQTPDVANFIWTQRYRKNYINRPRRSDQRVPQPQSPQIQNKTKPGTIKDAIKIQQIYPAKIQRAASVKVHYRKHSKKHSEISYETLSAQSKTNSFMPENNSKQFKSECQKITKKCEQKLELNKLIKYRMSSNLLMLNHLPGHRSLSDKKNLLDNMIQHCSKNNQDPFLFLPFTVKMINFEELNECQKKYSNKSKMWIVKPGQDSNRGKEIVVCKNWAQVQTEIANRFDYQKTPIKKPSTSLNKIKSIKNKTVIIQQYIMPLLYQQRKFDIRMYMLVTNFNKSLKAYLYEDGYLRTCSFKFSVTNDNCYAHLTNDAIQAKCYEYGKYEQGNKLPLKSLDKLLKQTEIQNCCKNWNEVWQKMKSICKTIVQSTKDKITKQVDEIKNITSDTQKEKAIHFQLFGLDYILDQKQKLWLIQVNTNPCLQTAQSRILNRVIPEMLDNVMKIAVQPYMRTLNQKDSIINNKFHVVYE